MLATQSPMIHQGEIGSPNSKIAVDDLDPDECEKILQVLQKDFELRQKEKERLERIEEDVNEEKSKIEILARKTKLNENVCIRCCQTFGIIFNRRQTCQDCKLFVCKSCCDFNKELKGYVCKICTSERELKMKSCDWFYNNVSKKFKRFGSAKIVRTLYMHQRDSKFGRFHSDNESDSGYDPSLYNSLQKGSLQSPRVKQRGHVTSVFPDPESVSRLEDELHPEGEGETTAVIPPDSSSSYVAIKTKTGDEDSDSETGPGTQNGLTRLNDASRAAGELDGRCEDDEDEEEEGEEEEEKDNVLPEQSRDVMSSREITRDSLTDTDDDIAMVTYDDMFGSDKNQAIDSILPPPPLFDIHQLANSPTNINNQLSPRNLTDKLNAQNADLNNHNNNNVVVDTSDLDTLLDNKHSVGVETTLPVTEQNSVGIETENFVPECHSIGTETASRGVNQNSVTTETCCPDLRDTQTDTNSLFGGPEDTRSDPDWKENKTNEIYREALEKTQHTEGKKFNNKFSDFLVDIKESLENQTPGAHGKTSYGGVAVSYTNRLRDILIGLSQRLEIAIDSFDRKSSPEDVNSKVKHLVTALVERSLGESLDFTADEAVSDLSSLSGEDADNHRGFEDGLAQAVVSKVLESYRQEHGLGPLNLSLDSDLESRSRDKPSQRSKWNRTSHTQKDSGVDLDHPDPRRRHWVKGQRADIYSDSDSIGVGDFDAESDYSDRGDRHLRSGQGHNQGSDRLRSKGQGPFPAPRSKRTAINKQWSQSEGNIYDLDPNSSRNHKSRSLNSSRSSYSEYDSDTVDAKERSARRSWDKPQAPFKGSELDFSYSENEEVYKTHNNKAKGVNHSSRSRGVSSLSDGEFRDTRHGYEYDDSDSGRPQRKDRTSRNSVPHIREPNGDLRRRSNSGNSQLTDKPRKSDINDPYSSSGRKNTSHSKKRVPDVSDSDLSFNQSFSDPEEDSSFQEEEAIGHIRAALASESVTSLESCHQTPNLRTAAGAASDEDTVKEGGSEGEEEEETEAGESHDQELAESDPEDQIQNLKSFLQNIHPRREIRQVEPEEEVVCVEEPSVEAVHVDRTEQQDDFLTKYSSISHAQEHQPPLPAFDLDLDLPNEIDPDLLSMNLAPILEEEEEEDEDEEEIDEDEDEYGDENEKMHNKSWRRNWIFNSSVSAYDNLGKKKIGSELGEVYMALPSIYTDIGPKVGNRDADELSDLSENDHLNGQEMEDELANLSDEENSFYARTSEEIARITRKPSSVHSTSIQTEDSELDTSKETFSDVKGQSSKASSSSEEAIRKKKKLLEELIPAEGDDPRFEIPPESVTVSEGESAKFTCRIGGTGSIEVFWYRVEEDMQELQNSQQYEVTREGNRSNLVVYFPSVKDAGQYMAIAIGEKGKCCQYLVLNVKKNTQELKAPEFIRGIADVETSEGRSAKFRCKVKGYPQPRVVWYKDGILLKSENNVKIEKFGNRDYILTVDNITMDDDAEYTVAAKNIAGEVKSCAQLLVDTEANRVGGSPKESTRLFLSHSSVSEDNTPNLSDIGDDPSQDSLHVSSFSRRLLSSRPSMPLHSQGEKKEKPKSATSAALKVLNSTQEAVESLEGQEQDLHCLATSTPRIEDEEPLPPYSETIDSPTAMSPYQRIMDTPTSGGRSGQPKSQMQVNVIQNASSAKPVIKVDITKSETLPSSSEITLTPQVLEEKGLNSSTSFSSDEIDYAAASYDVQTNPNTGSRRSESRIVVNLGPKKERTEAYSKEFYTPVVPKDQHKHWEVETTPHVAGEVVNRKDKEEEASKGANANKTVPQISIATPNIKLRKVEETHSQEPTILPHGGPQNTSPSLGSKTVTVTPQFQRTSPVKPIVEEKQTLSFQTPSYSASPSTPAPIIRVQEDRPLATNLKGHTGEDELPESRTELNEEAGVQLPSVNHLKAMFSRVHKADDSSVKRVHSITGRSIPAEQRNKYRRQNSSGSDDPAHSSPNSQSEGSLAATLTPAPVNTHLDPTQIFPRERGHLFPESDRLTTNPQNSLTSQRVLPPSNGATQTSVKKHKAPEPPTNKSHDTSTLTSGSHDPSQAGTTGEPSRKDGEQDGVAKRAPRIRSGCIAARASFWEKRIIDPNDVNDNEFPSMIEN